MWLCQAKVNRAAGRKAVLGHIHSHLPQQEYVIFLCEIRCMSNWRQSRITLVFLRVLTAVTIQRAKINCADLRKVITMLDQPLIIKEWFFVVHE